MISCKGELRNGKKYAGLAYLLLISGNSRLQKQMASKEKHNTAFKSSKKDENAHDGDMSGRHIF